MINQIVVEHGTDISKILDGCNNVKQIVEAVELSRALVPDKEIIAFEVCVLDDVVCGEGESQSTSADTQHTQEKVRRTLKERPSDAIDLTDPALRAKFKDIVQSYKKKGSDPATYDGFAAMVAEVLRQQPNNGNKHTLTSALALATRVTLRAVPRDIDFILNNEKHCAPGLNLMVLREKFVSKLALLATPIDQISLLESSMARFADTMDAYQFPRYSLDVDAFVTDLVVDCSMNLAEAESAARAAEDDAMRLAAAHEVNKVQEKMVADVEKIQNEFEKSCAEIDKLKEELRKHGRVFTPQKTNFMPTPLDNIVTTPKRAANADSDVSSPPPPAKAMKANEGGGNNAVGDEGGNATASVPTQQLTGTEGTEAAAAAAAASAAAAAAAAALAKFRFGSWWQPRNLPLAIAYARSATARLLCFD